MSRVIWKEGKVISVGLRNGVSALAQMYKSPYLMFFNRFSEDGSWANTDLEETPVLFICAVTRQFLRQSKIETVRMKPRLDFPLPTLWIREFPGSRTVVVYPGTAREAEFVTTSSKPGGRLVEIHIDRAGFQETPTRVESIPLYDDETIDGHEVDAVWIYPSLNERLYICYLTGENVDPEKDITFDRPMRDEYAEFIEVKARRKRASDLGY